MVEVAVPVLDADLFGSSKDLRSIAILREFEPAEGYWLAFSGGKDSTVLYDLAVRAGVRFEAHYARTGIDPPELTAHIKRHYPDVTWDSPDKPFMSRIPTHGLPVRTRRWCCSKLKEHSGKGRIVATGVRAEESNKRATYGTVRHCQRLGKTFVAPILDWTSSDVWTYIRRRELPYCCLYDEGWTRIGCVLCPFESNVERSMERWPQLWGALRRAVEKAYPRVKHWQRFGSAQAVWDWWIDRSAPWAIDDAPQLFDPSDVADDDGGSE